MGDDSLHHELRAMVMAALGSGMVYDYSSCLWSFSAGVATVFLNY